jgi:hypothetical protein
VVWTDGTASDMWHELSEAMSSAGLINVRVSTEMEEKVGNIEIRPALRYSDDGFTWNTAKEIVATYRTTNGTDVGTSYVDITGLAGTTPHAFVQFGVVAANTSGSSVNIALAEIRIEPKELVQ